MEDKEVDTPRRSIFDWLDFGGAAWWRQKSVLTTFVELFIVEDKEVDTSRRSIFDWLGFGGAS